jgi:hypothetical protein
LPVVEREKKRQFYQWKPGGLGSEKETILTVQAWKLGSGKVTILPVRSWRLGERKGDNFNNVYLEVWGAEKRQFYQCKLGGWGSGNKTILTVQAWRLGSGKVKIYQCDLVG